MDKKRAIVISIFVFLIAGIFFVNAVSHNANQIVINIDGVDRTLQYAIDNNLLFGGHTYAPASQVPDPGHSANEIWISTDDGEMTLREALSQGVQLTRSSFLGYSLFNIPRKFQLATNVILSSGQSLQDVINAGLCESHVSTECYDYDIYWVDACGNRQEKKEDCGYSESATSPERCVPSNYHCDGLYNLVYTETCTRYECSEDVECVSYVTSTTTKTQNCASLSSDYICCPATASCSKQSLCGGTPVESGGSVICTELYNKGYLTEEEWENDAEYFDFFSDAAVNGYHAFAIPAVRAMRKNPLEAISHVLPLVKSFTEEMAYRLGKRETGNEVGALFLDRGVPLFERIDANPDELLENYFTEDKVKEIYYDAKERSNSNKEFANTLLDNLEKSAEEIEKIAN